MTIDEVYKLVQTFANKEQRGFITPSEFNLLAKQAELELYNKRLSIIKEKSPTRRSQGIYGEGLSPEVAKQDISRFLIITRRNTSNSSQSYIGAEFSLECDYLEAIMHSHDESFNVASNIPIEIVEAKDVNQILRSNLVSPSMMYPIALMTKASTMRNKIVYVSVTLNIFPENISEVVLYYYLYDNLNSPNWSYATVAGKPVYDVTSSRQFSIAPRVHGELVIKILEYLGVTIREADVVQYAQGSELKADS
tara:strand:- start:641 stop:1393 length:753 start_codon:yes stop_codon:yes gene_type:complete